MPQNTPRKKKIWETQSQKLVEDHQITFEGPKRPKDWPREHSHIFQAIREISAVSFEDYVTKPTGETLNREAWRKRRDMVTEVSMRVHKLCCGRNNELTWRDLEANFMDIFNQRAVCEFCKNETIAVERQAQPLATKESERLSIKRKARMSCTCAQRGGSQPAGSEQRNERDPFMFTTLLSTTLLHDSLDNIKEFGIPMGPDRTIGLSINPQMRHALGSRISELQHWPLQDLKDTAYPFVLIEAKKSVNTPGFAAVEKQTAFPLRRLLRIQQSLKCEAGVCFDPFVWFFAYQGEDWRLYAGTLRQESVHVYNIWHGTVESCDGLLQLLQIVDYIWTWARDIYRPKIFKALFALVPEARGNSPFTDISLSRSQSVLSETTLRPRKRSRLDTSVGEGGLIDDLRSCGDSSATAKHAHRLHQYSPNSANGEQCRYPQTGLRHSDLILFSFRSFRCPSRAQASRNHRIQRGHAITLEIFDSLRRSETVIFFDLRSSEIKHLERLWTGDDSDSRSAPGQMVALDERKGAYFYFRTFCRGTDWQIVRELNCVFCDLIDVQHPVGPRPGDAFRGGWNQPTEPDYGTHLVRLLAMVRDMTGKMSVSYAMNNTRLVPSKALESTKDSKPIRWEAERSSHLEHLENPASRAYWSPESYSESWKLVALEPQALESTDSELPMVVPSNWGHVGGILTKKPQSWHAECPKFCFFVLLDIEASDKGQLGQLFSSMLRHRECYGVTEEGPGQEALYFDKEDARLLREWLKWFTR